jgi:hypothetical protein
MSSVLRPEKSGGTVITPSPNQAAWIGKAAPDHAQEWQASGVDLGIVALNVETLTDTASNPNADSLFPIAERLNWTIKRFGQKPRPTLRGWWVSGIDPLTWEPMLWGRFKPDANTPVIDRQRNRPAKYLSPSWGAGSSRLILLNVPDPIWERVAQRYGLPMPTERKHGFWHWVWQQQIPIVLTEGEKKAGCLLTLGYAAIALPGIFGGYRKATGKLISELERFATEKRSVLICFDYDTRPTTKRNVTLAITKLGQLLQAANCSVQVIALPGPEKGVDDFVMVQGATAFDHLYETALPLGLWQARQLWALTHPATVKLNQPYLDNLPYPPSGLVCIKSAKGTGKTTALQGLIRHATQTGRKVLVITHRIQLGRAICESIGIDWIETIRDPVSAGSETQGLLGYGLCIDSLHPASQARFNPQMWKGAIVILDEVEQVLWHALNSLTCYEHRVKILETLRELVQVVLASNGLLIAQDADLSDVSVDYLLKLSDVADPSLQPITPWIILNEWQAQQGWNVSFYDTPNPAALVTRLTEVAKTGAVFIALDSQKVRGRWSSKNLERYLQNQFPQKRILRIDSESVADPDHPAYGIGERLNQEIARYDIVLATPTMGTGVSIDVQHHFKAVFGIFQGVTPDAESRQALARVRDPVPRYVWAAPFGPGKIGNGSCNYQDVVTSTTRLVKYNIALLKDIDFDIDQQTDPITLRTWAKMAARVNTSLWSFRQQLAQGLQNEGHQLTIVTDDLNQLFGATQTSNHSNVTAQTIADELVNGNLQIPGYEFLDCHHSKLAIGTVLADLSAVRQNHREQEAIAIFTAPDLPASDYEALKNQRTKTRQERCAVQKYELQKRYAVPITAELKLRDDQGWFTQLRLHYYLTHNVTLVHSRDYKEWQGHLERGDGKVALQDVRLLTAQVEALKGLGILHLLDPVREVRASDADVQQIAQFCIQYSQDIKTLFNLTISERMTPIEIIQALLSKLGLKLTCVRRDQAPDGRRGGLRVYQYRPPNDHRDAIFAHWQERDAANGLSHLTPSTTDSVIEPDPPPDILIINQSPVGSNSKDLNVARLHFQVSERVKEVDSVQMPQQTAEMPNASGLDGLVCSQSSTLVNQPLKSTKKPTKPPNGKAHQLGYTFDPNLNDRSLLMYPN